MKKLVSVFLAISIALIIPAKADSFNAKTYFGLGFLAAGTTSAALAFKFYSDYKKNSDKHKKE